MTSVTGEHNHEPDPALLSTAKAKAQLKERAASTQETTQNIISGVLSDLSPMEAAVLPEPGALRRAVQRARSASHNVPASPASLAELQVPERYARTSDGRTFLLHDSGPEDGDQRLLVFATDASLDRLERYGHWFLDGTFKCVPRLFAQLYTIHVSCDGTVLPAVFALLPNKQQQTYTRFVSAVAESRPGLAPETIKVDFEAGAINALRAAFPDAQIQGCYFHLSQNIFRHVQSSGLQDRYADNIDFAMEIRKLAALAFVPIADVIAYFELLEESAGFPEAAEPVLEYFEQYYIGRRRRNGVRRTPAFPIPLWNVHAPTLDGLPRTNNNVEGWHRRFSGHLLCNHPTVWKLISALQLEEKEVEQRAERLAAGEEGPRRKKKYVDVDRRLRRLCQTFEARTPQDFLRGVAYNLRLQQM